MVRRIMSGVESVLIAPGWLPAWTLHRRGLWPISASRQCAD